jgi:hypothetical protein
MPLIFGAILHVALSVAGVTATVLAMLMGKLLLACVLAAFTLGAWLRFRRSGALPFAGQRSKR